MYLLGLLFLHVIAGYCRILQEVEKFAHYVKQLLILYLANLTVGRYFYSFWHNVALGIPEKIY